MLKDCREKNCQGNIYLGKQAKEKEKHRQSFYCKHKFLVPTYLRYSKNSTKNKTYACYKIRGHKSTQQQTLLQSKQIQSRNQHRSLSELLRVTVKFECRMRAAARRRAQRFLRKSRIPADRYNQTQVQFQNRAVVRNGERARDWFSFSEKCHGR